MIEFLIVIFILLNALDTFVSIYALKLGMHEKYPIMAKIVNNYGIIGFLFVKVIVMGVVLIFSDLFHLDTLIILNILYTLIVSNNGLKLYIHRSS